MSLTLLFRAAVVLSALAVAAGAFGAHGLKEHLTAERLEVWKTGASYLLVHAAAASALALAGRASAQPALFGVGLTVLLAGAVVFAGTLFLLCLTDVRAWGAVTPLGGLGMIVGWILLAFGTRLVD
jgi:uncharacterized membrane protein YgdD (TMEM256/DUF423 family)